MKTGIYAIRNNENGKTYIGQSVDIKKRWAQHNTDLLANRHKNKHLQSSWNLYGKEQFSLFILCYCSIEYLTEMEQYFIDKVGFENLYNICPASESRLGAKMTVESRERISMSKKGSIAWNKGKTKKDFPKMGNSGVKKGNIAWNKGVPCRRETKNKLSKINTGKILSNETKTKISKTMKLKEINPHKYEPARHK